MNINPYQGFASRAAVAVASRNADFRSSGIDVRDYVGSLAVALYSGAGGALETMDVKVQHSADLASWTDVTSGAFAQVVGSNVYQVLPIDTRAISRYIRIHGTISGTFIAGVSILGRKQVQP